jgi:hypothetical protein
MSKLPNYNVLNVENLSQNNNASCWNCDIFPKAKTEFQLVVEDPCRLLVYKKGSFEITYAFNFDTLEVDLREDFKSAPTEFL